MSGNGWPPAIIRRVVSRVRDIAARVIRYPYEIPVGTFVAVVGAALFLTMLLRGRRR